MTTRETPIKDRCMRYLRKLSHSKWLKTHGSQYGVVGTPDILGCYRGQMFAFEVKRTGERATERQEEELSQWQQAGARASVVYDADDCFAMLVAYLTPEDREIQP